MKKEMTESAKCLQFEDYLLARSRKSAGRYLRVAQRFLEANPGEENPFEASHVNSSSPASAEEAHGGRPCGGTTSSSRSSALWVIPPVDQYGTE